MHLSKIHKAVQHRVSPSRNCGLEVIVMYQYWLNCNKYITGMQDVNKREYCGRGSEGIWELSSVSLSLKFLLKFTNMFYKRANPIS